MALGSDVTVDELVQGCSPALDLDSLYGRGPVQDKHFYRSDGIKLRIGTTAAIAFDAGTNVNRTGFDLPRAGTGSTKAEEPTAQIPDTRNDENVAVAQTHVGRTAGPAGREHPVVVLRAARGRDQRRRRRAHRRRGVPPVMESSRYSILRERASP
jgi:hypothetical protein